MTPLPRLIVDDWEDTKNTLHLLMQIVSKVRIADDPLNTQLEYLRYAYVLLATARNCDMADIKRAWAETSGR